jgi:hypothetical protein
VTRFEKPAVKWCSSFYPYFFYFGKMATLEEVERAILAFYNGQNVVEANAWLTSFVASQVR